MDDERETEPSSAVTISADRYDDLAVAVTSAVATAEELSPLELPPLADVGVDPEALNSLFGTARDPSLEFTFRYAGYLVSLFGDGTLRVAPPDI
ncbi:HalOD1 output domain-containing protein [Haloferax namakaokahaiae]|uniref:HalOD1 output domain-containing protein n=1 Tax=Haloferax namakaokahaiae TaxID=1748331 RepID=A0ABD5ZGE5_9EURY